MSKQSPLQNHLDLIHYNAMPLFPSDSSDSDSAPGAPRRRKILWLPIVLALGYALFQYLGADTVILPETGQSVRVGLTNDQEAALGAQSFQEVLNTSDVLSSGPEVEEVTRVARRLIKALDPESQKFQWAVSVVDSKEQNAFCLPGGKVVVYTGILPVTQNDAGLAAVLGHEFAHATLHHGAQRMLQQQLVQTALMGAQGSLSDMDTNQRRTIMGVIGAGAQYGVLLPFGRDHETQADEIGLHYLVRAGYDPQEAVAFWERMNQLSGGKQPPEWASTHPSHGSRINRIKELIPSVIEQESGNGVHVSDDQL